MKVAFLLTLSLALAAPVQAQTILQSRTVPAKVRYGYVYETAKLACPAAEDHLFKGGTKVGFIDRVADKAILTDDERSLLFAMCDIYKHGRERNPWVSQ